MYNWREPEINKEGHLILGGCDAVDLAAKYQTPLYVMEEDKMRAACRAYVNAMRKYDANGKVVFASKAFLNTAVCKIIEQQEMGLDAVSGGELYTAKNADFPMDRVYFHGNNKTDAEIEMALSLDVGCIVLDAQDEIGRVQAIASRMGKQARVSIRVKPGIEAHTHHYIQTATVDSKFGFGLRDGDALNALRRVSAIPEFQLVGLHCHIGSQIFELKPYEMATDVLTDFIIEIKKEIGVDIQELNFGGGLGIYYTDEDEPVTAGDYVDTLMQSFNAQCKKKGIPQPRAVIEPGRSIVGEAGTTLYTVGTVKRIPDVRTYISVDGGMGDNIRPALYQAEYSVTLANKMNQAHTQTVTVAGRYCESSDMLAKDVPLPDACAGDILAVFSTGAYNYAMASNYNRVGVPAVVLVKDGKSALMCKRQDYADIIRNDVIPAWLTE